MVRETVAVETLALFATALMFIDLCEQQTAQFGLYYNVRAFIRTVYGKFERN